jgi:hypothetical protein
MRPAWLRKFKPSKYDIIIAAFLFIQANVWLWVGFATHYEERKAQEEKETMEREMEAQIRKVSQAPFLEYAEELNPGRDEINVSLLNSGLGIAVIKEADIFVDAAKVAGWEQAVKECGLKADSAHYEELNNGSSLHIGKQQKLFSYTIKGIPKDEKDNAIACLGNRMRLMITYCSLEDNQDCQTACWPNQECPKYNQ